MSAPLAEVVEEGRRLEEAFLCSNADPYTLAVAADNLLTFQRKHWGYLTRMAEAAVEMRAKMDRAPYSHEWAVAVAVFDAAARGEK